MCHLALDKVVAQYRAGLYWGIPTQIQPGPVRENFLMQSFTTSQYCTIICTIGYCAI